MFITLKKKLVLFFSRNILHILEKKLVLFKKETMPQEMWASYFSVSERL